MVDTPKTWNRLARTCKSGSSYRKRFCFDRIWGFSGTFQGSELVLGSYNQSPFWLECLPRGRLDFTW